MKKKRRREGQKEAAESQPSAVEEHDSEAKSFGPWLRRQREGRGIELRDIAQASKISVRYLDALENNQFEALPAEIFTKGFLRQYSSFVGLDQEEVVNYYLAAKAAADDEKADEVPDELRLDRNQSQGGPPYVILILLVTAALVALIWWYSQRQAVENPSTPATPNSQTEQSTAATGGAPSDPRPGNSQAGEARVDGPQTSDSSTSPVADGGTDSASSSTQVGDNAPSSEIDGGNPPQTATAGTATAGAPAAPIELVLDFKDDCWVEASIDGQPRIAEMHVQGESLRLAGNTSIELMVGNIDAVGLELNGRSWQPPGASKPVRRMSIDLETVRGGGAAPTSASAEENSEGAP